MIIVDASAMIEALVGANPASELLDALAQDIHAPHLLDIEVASVLRGLELGRSISPERAEQARSDYWAFTIQRHELEPLADRHWQLRHQFTSYDAAYLALAEALTAPLVTCDKKLATTGHPARVIMFGVRDELPLQPDGVRGRCTPPSPPPDPAPTSSAQYFLIDGRIVAKREAKGDQFHIKGRGWIPDDGHAVQDRLMGYDPYEPDGSPYKMFNTSIMDSIDEIGEAEARTRTGEQPQ